MNGFVGQLSDPYEQGEDEGLGISISGLPGELDEPEPDEDAVPGGPEPDGDTIASAFEASKMLINRCATCFASLR